MSSTQTVPIGEIRIARHHGELRTLLGSCVGLALYSPQTLTAGLAHILLSDSGGQAGCSPSADSAGRYVDTAIPELIRLVAASSDTSTSGTTIMHAHVAGGADMFETRAAVTVGGLNIAALESILQSHGIEVRSRDYGGTRARSMTIDAATGQVRVRFIPSPTKTPANQVAPNVSSLDGDLNQ